MDALERAAEEVVTNAENEAEASMVAETAAPSARVVTAELVRTDEALELALAAPPSTIEVACETTDEMTLDARLRTDETTEEMPDSLGRETETLASTAAPRAAPVVDEEAAETLVV